MGCGVQLKLELRRGIMRDWQVGQTQSVGTCRVHSPRVNTHHALGYHQFSHIRLFVDFFCTDGDAEHLHSNLTGNHSRLHCQALPGLRWERHIVCLCPT
jgi:hypothetical protein